MSVDANKVKQLDVDIKDGYGGKEMKIHSVQRNTMINAYNNPRQPLKQGEMIKQNKDKVTISEDAKYLNQINSNNENVNIDKINEIKSRIKQGTYSVNSKAVAKKIIEATKGE